MFFEQLGSVIQAFVFRYHFGLRDGLCCASGQVIHRLHEQMLSSVEQSVMNITCGVVGANRNLHLAQHVARVNLVFEQESGRARGRFPVEHGPVDGGRSAILGQQRAMEVHRA